MEPRGRSGIPLQVTVEASGGHPGAPFSRSGVPGTAALAGQRSASLATRVANWR